jgi:hypothetical protein
MTATVQQSPLDAFVAQCVLNASVIERVEPEHVYRHRQTEQLLLGMTTALKDAGYIDGAHHAPVHAERGHFVHDATLLIDDDDLDFDAVPPQFVGYCTSYQRFVDIARPTWLLREQIVYNAALGVAGTLDRCGFLCDPNVASARPIPTFGIVDFKAGAREKWHRVQTAGYARCLPPNAPLPIQRWCLYLHADGRQATLVPHTDRRDDAYFIAAVTCCRFKQER